MIARCSLLRLLPLLLATSCLLGFSMDLHGQRHRREMYIGCTLSMPEPTKLPWENPDEFHRICRQYFSPAKLDFLSPRVYAHEVGATLVFQIGDVIDRFHGQFDLPAADSLPPVQNWHGIDSFAVALARDIILEVTTYDPVRFPQLDSVTCLGGPLTIGLDIVCKFDTIMMEFGAGSPPYLGEFSFLHPGSDTLRIALKVEGRDTSVSIAIAQDLNLFEYTALNGLAIQLQINAAMAKYCGFAPDYLLQLPPQQRGIFPLIARPITMTMDNYLQRHDILTNVSLRFGSSFKPADLKYK